MINEQPENGKKLTELTTNGSALPPVRPRQEQETADLREWLEIAMRRWRWMLLLFIAVIILAVVWTASRQRYYAAIAEVMASKTISISDNSSSSIPALKSLESLSSSRTVSTQVRMLQSPDFQDEVFQQLAPEMRVGGVPKVDIVNTEKDEVISITVTATSPERATEFARLMVKTYIAKDIESSREMLTTALKYIDKEQKRVSRELADARRNIAEFEMQYGTIGDGGKLSQFKDRIRELEMQTSQAEQDAIMAGELKVLLAKKLTTQDPTIVLDVTEEQNPLIDKIDMQIQDLEGKRIELALRLVPDAPEIKRIEESLQAVQERRQRYLETRVTSKKNTVNPIFQQLQADYIKASTDEDIAIIRTRVLKAETSRRAKMLANLPSLEIRAGDMVGQVKFLEETYALLSQNYQTMRISEAAKVSNIRIISQPKALNTPVSPNVMKNMAIAVLLGLLLAVGLAALLEIFDDRIYSQKIIERLSNRPMLAYIPFVHDQDPLISKNDSKHNQILESMRLLRSNIDFTALDKSMRVIAVTSAGAGEGKSTTAANLAAVLALDGKKVLLVDADLRKPKVHDIFEVDRSVGLTNILTQNMPISEAITKSTIEGVSLLTSGPLPPNPPEVLNSQATRRVIADLAKMFDYVILDTPPAAGLSDVSVIASLVDGMIIVIAANQARRLQLQGALATLEQLGAPIIGFVFNKINPGSGRYGYYYNYYYYNYYYYTAYGDDEQTPGNKRKRRKHRSENK